VGYVAAKNPQMKILSLHGILTSKTPSITLPSINVVWYERGTLSNNKLLPPGKRILIVDGYKMLRDALRSLLEERLGYECVAEANDGYEAVKKAKQFHPDIVIMDITLPNFNGIEAIRQIKSEQSDIKVVVLFRHATRGCVQQALEAGASGYLHKDSRLEDLSAALAAVSKGSMYLSPIPGSADELSVSKNVGNAARLTRRELQVVQLIADGNSTKEIAAILAVSEKTIETHRKQIMDKLDIHSVAGLTKYCVREGLTLL
jgi:DNA-binding NarL/FixJ family response regulator